MDLLNQTKLFINMQSIALKTVFIIVGFAPITCIALAVGEICSLSLSALVYATPVYLTALLLGIQHKAIGSLALFGWLSGIVAVGIYDISRIPFILQGWPDFIPKIGNWLLGVDNAPPIVGYAWRYLGNGGGMGMAFFMLLSLFKVDKKLVVIGITYGLFIFSCLIITLLLSPNGEKLMFELTPFTFTGSIIGHIVYGLVLGLLIKKYFNKHKS